MVSSLLCVCVCVLMWIDFHSGACCRAFSHGQTHTQPKYLDLHHDPWKLLKVAHQLLKLILNFTNFPKNR